MTVQANQNRGFTLLELMVVIFIIGLMVGVVGLNVAQFDAAGELQDFGEDTYAQLSFGTDQALFGGEHIGLVPEPLNENEADLNWRLGWHRWRDGQWQPISEIPAIEPPSFVDMTIQIDEEPVDLWQWLEYEDPLPVIIFYGGGEALAATLIFELDAQAAREVTDFESRSIHMDINELGYVVWRERSEQDERAAGLR